MTKVTTSPSDRLAAAKGAMRPIKDVQILLDTDLAAQRESLRDEVARVKAEGELDPRLTSVNENEQAVQDKLDAILEESASALVTIRFKRLPGDVWADIADRCPARPDAPVDRHFGYDTLAAAKMAAPLSGSWLVGDEEVPLEDSEWADLFATIAGTEATAISSAIFELNVYDPQMDIAALVKELASRPA